LCILPDDLYYSLTMAVTTKKKALALIEKRGIVRSRDLEAHGISRTLLAHLVEDELVVREARGLYVAARHEPSESHTLVQVAKRVPEAVFCLLTALRFHELTTQSPSEVWIAIAEKARRPNLDHPRLRVARFSGAALTTGVETHQVEGVTIRVTSAAKTVADCFKYRNKIGIDVAVEALRDFARRYRGGSSELARCARVCRVARIMQPYLDSVA
jgi:predicted transcriptional regulator of viral defense system